MTRPFNALLACTLCVALPACAQSGAESSTQASFDGRQLELREQNGRCTVVDPGGTNIDLLLKWPCQFHLGDDGELRTKQVGGGKVLLVESSEKMPAPSKDCRTEIQAIRTIADGRLEPSSNVSRVASCPPFQWDEKVFIGLFDEPQA